MKIGYCTGSCEQGRKQCDCSTSGDTLDVSDNVVVLLAALFVTVCCVYLYFL